MTKLSMKMPWYWSTKKNKLLGKKWTKVLSRLVVYTLIVSVLAYFVFAIAVHFAPDSFPSVNIFYLDIGFCVIGLVMCHLFKRLHEYQCGYGWLYDHLMQFLMAGFE